MIGVFDSGSGGLTVLRRLRERMPRADVLYFGDIIHAPYGLKTGEELAQLTAAAIERLTSGGATSIVSACNSVSAALAVSVMRSRKAPERLIEMVAPTVSSLQQEQGRILVCATRATINSKIYEHAFHQIGKEVVTCAIPDLAGAIEKGASEDALRTMLREALASRDDYDVLVLSCTHYPLVLPLFREVVGEKKSIVDPGDAVAKHVAEQWSQDEQGTGTLTFWISQDSQPFRLLVERLFPSEQIHIQVVE